MLDYYASSSTKRLFNGITGVAQIMEIIFNLHSKWLIWLPAPFLITWKSKHRSKKKYTKIRPDERGARSKIVTEKCRKKQAFVHASGRIWKCSLPVYGVTLQRSNYNGFRIHKNIQILLVLRAVHYIKQQKVVPVRAVKACGKVKVHPQ